MRWLLALWATPLVLFWGWYFVSLNDWNFGYVLLTRQAHDLIFQIYGEMVGIDPAELPMMLVRVFLFDTFLLSLLIAFRKRRELTAWFRARRAAYSEASPSA